MRLRATAWFVKLQNALPLPDLMSIEKRFRSRRNERYYLRKEGEVPGLYILVRNQYVLKMFNFRGESSVLSASHIPDRPVIAVYHHVRRGYHPMKQQGKWIPNEDEALRT